MSRIPDFKPNFLLHESVLVIEKQLGESATSQAVGNLGYVVIKKNHSQAYLTLNALWMFFLTGKNELY